MHHSFIATITDIERKVVSSDSQGTFLSINAAHGPRGK